MLTCKGEYFLRFNETLHESIEGKKRGVTFGKLIWQLQPVLICAREQIQLCIPNKWIAISWTKPVNHECRVILNCKTAAIITRLIVYIKEFKAIPTQGMSLQLYITSGNCGEKAKDWQACFSRYFKLKLGPYVQESGG